MISGALDAQQSSPVGQGVEKHVFACDRAPVLVTARDKWGNAHTDQIERLFGVIVGGGAANGSTKILQETLVVFRIPQESTEHCV